MPQRRRADDALHKILTAVRVMHTLRHYLWHLWIMDYGTAVCTLRIFRTHSGYSNDLAMSYLWKTFVARHIEQGDKAAEQGSLPVRSRLIGLKNSAKCWKGVHK